MSYVEIGGLALSPIEENVIEEEFGWGSVGLTSGLEAGSLPFALAARLGSAELIEEHVIPFRDDKKAEYIGRWAITEPEHGGGDWQPYVPKSILDLQH